MSHKWKKLLKGGLSGGVSTLAKAIGHWLLIKGIAVYFGPSGISIHAQIVNIINIFVIIHRQGISRGLVKILSSPRAAGKTYWRVSSRISMLIFAIIGIILLILQELGIYEGVGYEFSQVWWLGFFLCLFSYLFYPILQGYFQAYQQFAVFSFFTSIGGLIAAAIVWADGGNSFSLALMALPISLLITSLLAWLYAFKNKTILTRQQEEEYISDYDAAKNLLPYIVLALATWLDSGVEYSIRSFSIETLGLEQTSYWQAPATLSNYYVTAFSTTFLFVFYPTISKKMANKEPVLSILLKSLMAMAAIIGAGLSCIYLLREPLIDLLFAPTLRGAVALMATHTLGDFFCLLSSIIIYFLLASGYIRWLFAYQIIGVIIRVICLYFLFEEQQLHAFPTAYLYTQIAGFAFLLVALYFYARKNE